jgi:integrase
LKFILPLNFPFSWHTQITTSKILCTNFIANSAKIQNIGFIGSTLKDLMGHSSIRCTEQYYLKSSTPNQLAAVEVLNGLLEVV